MDESKKTTLGIVSLIALYVGISLFNIYYVVEMVMFPIIAIPCIIYFLKHRLDIKEHIVFQLCIVLGIYIVTGDLLCVTIYLMSVLVPSVIITNLYKRGYTLPNTVMASTVIFSGVVFLFYMVMKQLGIDFEAKYLEGLDQIKTIWISEIDKLVVSQSQMLDQEVINEVKSIVSYMIDSMKPIYSATIFINITMSMGIILIISNSIARIKNKKLPSAKQFLEFRLSRTTILLLLVSVLVVASGSGGTWEVVGLNIMVLLTNLFQVVGLLALIGLLSKIKFSKALKVFGYIMIFILFISSSGMMMTFGCLDTLFNYRKVKIVV